MGDQPVGEQPGDHVGLTGAPAPQAATRPHRAQDVGPAVVRGS